MYSVALAKMEHLPRILEIYSIAREFMASNGNPHQWGKTNPPKETLLKDIENGNLYVICDDATLRGVFMFRIGEDPTYQKIREGDWHFSGTYGVIHRVAGDGTGGIFRACLDFCASQSRHLRIDTHEDNKVMQHVLEKNGFSRCGMILTESGSPRIAYDRA